MAAGSHWVKIDRALDHIDALEKSIEAWVSEHDPYSVREQHGPYLHPDPDGGLPTLLRNVTRTALVLHVSEPFPPAWSAYIGDAVHNLRSALDHLALALNSKGYADANQGAVIPPCDAFDSEFPIFGDVDRKGQAGQGPTLFVSGGKKIRHVPGAARLILEGVQPYKRGQEWATDPLWLIHDLDNIDKHRQLVLSTVATHGLDVHLFKIDGPHLASGIGLGKPLDEGGELAYWALMPDNQFGPDEPKPKVEYDLGFTFRVAFGKGTPCAGWPVVKTLRHLRDHIRLKVAFRLDKFC